MEDSEGVSAYELRRMENIRRNEAVLASLEIGLVKKGLGVTRKETPRRSKGIVKRLRGQNEPRRSRRLKKVKVEKKQEVELPVPKPPRMSVSKLMKVEHSVQVTSENGIRVEASAIQGPSSKEVDARLEEIEGTFLGKIILPPEGSGSMKAAAMNAIGTVRPRFSKYSGIQQFRNCVALFVNVQPAVDEVVKYNNSFRLNDKTRNLQMLWFSQDRQTLKTPVIERLLDDDEKVYLFLRLQGQAYLCAGRMQKFSVPPNTKPVQIWWELCNTKKLLASEGFNEIARLGRIDCGFH